MTKEEFRKELSAVITKLIKVGTALSAMENEITDINLDLARLHRELGEDET